MIKKSNEELVEEIRAGHNVQANMGQLYSRNLPLIRQFIKQFTAYEELEDLVQESFFGLLEAARHYETAENVKFMTFAKYWIVQAVRRYLENSGSLIRIPTHKRQQINQYNKFSRNFEQENGRSPTVEESAEYLCISGREVQRIQTYNQSIASLDKPLTDDGFTLAETIPNNADMEQDVIDRIHADNVRSIVWDVVDDCTSDLQAKVLRDYYHGKTLTEIGREIGISTERARQIHAAGLRKLRIGRARRQLEEKCEIVIADLYRTGFASFKHKGSSSVEDIVIRLEGLEEQYKAGVL